MRSSRGRRALLAGMLLASIPLAVAVPIRAQDVVPLDPMRPEAPDAETAPGDRSHELLDYECRSELGRRRVTLFANGTVRVWDGLHESQRMTLGELGPDELAAFVRRLRAEDFSEVAPVAGTEGEWVERCAMRLALAGQPSRHYAFGRYDSLPLALAST